MTPRFSPDNQPSYDPWLWRVEAPPGIVKLALERSDCPSLEEREKIAAKFARQRGWTLSPAGFDLAALAPKPPFKPSRLRRMGWPPAALRSPPCELLDHAHYFRAGRRPVAIAANPWTAAVMAHRAEIERLTLFGIRAEVHIDAGWHADRPPRGRDAAGRSAAVTSLLVWSNPALYSPP